MPKETSFPPLRTIPPISKMLTDFPGRAIALMIPKILRNSQFETNKKKIKYIYMPAAHHAYKIRIEVEKERKARQSENLQKAIFVIRMSWAVCRSQRRDSMSTYGHEKECVVWRVESQEKRDVREGENNIAE